ncbi:MAG: hypothetical protein KJZ57_07960, partial [Anaerolineales bacterium]|nr:hypothetical protein [Anaerolineales bacterium]
HRRLKNTKKSSGLPLGTKSEKATRPYFMN